MADSKKYDGSQWEHSLRKLTTATESVENPLYSDGTAITAYTLKGNEEHTGTPSPQNPVMPNGVGERTENLFDKNATNTSNGYVDNYRLNSGVPDVAAGNFITEYIEVEPSETYTISGFTAGWSSSVSWYDSNYTLIGYKLYENKSVTSFTVPSNAKYIRFTGDMSKKDVTMLNTGSTAKPYEPYGYKIGISNGQQSIDIYIGDLPLLKSLDGTAVDEISNGTLTRRVDSDGSVLPTPTTTQITMPSIPTTEGANSISVDTTVQPSEFTASWTGWHDAYVKEWDGSDWN